MSRTLSVALASAASLALLAPAALAAPNDAEATEAAADYIAENVTPEDNGAGANADAVLALLAAGGHDDQVAELVEVLRTQAGDYAGAGGPAAGKLALVAAATGADATDFGGVDLIAAIQDSIAEDGTCGDFAYAFGNALCIIGLDRNGAEVPDELLANSLAFQGPKGAFGFTGEDGFVPENDATGMMLTALSGVADDRDAALAAAAARDYLVEAQADDGSWDGYVPVNTTGLVAPALQTLGVDIEDAVTWVAGQQTEDGGLPAEVDGETSDLMATTQGILPLAGESYLSVGEGGTDLVELSVQADQVTRVGGENRYETAAQASERSFQPIVDTVYVATGQEFADALTGSALAGHQSAPVLLVQQDNVPQATATELARLDADRVVVLGGDVAVSDDVVAELAEVSGTEVTRLAGENRYETAADVAGEFTEVDHVFVATGLEYADALAASAAAGADGVPVLLVNEGGVPDATAAYLEGVEPSSITVLGGTKAVADETVEELLAYTDTVDRIAGENRYETAAALSAQRGGAEGVVLATGQDYPDALTGAAYAAMGEEPVVLVQQNRVPNDTLAEFDRLAARTVLVLGGPAAVAEAVVEQVTEHDYAG
ncbi:cell wall-binding repeat-containing protein [Ornithinimicrobium murale]|uniref:cell wall-binding repeat-containing protein n=1 Tax=Ornithinimicrobium murale TaxID=1050153 RepID=UPI000E0DE527|nr:cell wall-binding repeat-containing protein [Ornithinimicrobium murale]